jgi:2-amino-4-hydroxy-6-hydroxymethyldihydropteridine diphosphokinase / dihydropteroate synthase
MKSIHPRPLIKVRALTSSHVRPPRSFRAGFRVSTPAASIRHQSSLPEDVKPSTWTQHGLSNFQVFPNEPYELSRAGAEPHLAYIAFGSNIGDRIDWIERACNEMTEQGIKILRTSCLWETDPMYVLDQDKFVNGVCEVSFPPPFSHVHK